MLGLGATTCATRMLEVAEPGFGLVTEMLMSPTSAAVALPVAVSWVEETKVVGNGCEPKLTMEPFMKPEPVRVSSKLPVVMMVGVSVLRTGAAFCRVTAEFPDLVESAKLVAVMVMELGLGRVLGAV